MMSESEKTSGWFRHRRSGQIFEAEGYQYLEALKNRDLEEVAEEGDASTPSTLVALRERLDVLGVAWAESDNIDALNALLEAKTKELQEKAASLKIKFFPNWRPETLLEKIAEAQ